ncbi:Unannotated [Lentimonas sp. CC4]|nr:Unannotated [Lentimonas sp. CC4]CAA6684475.1 Unannotated [Lentimonas sp. CC6]CAA7077445.1 Unannotated [Lentimonas sp. CC4]CAA7171280.1 Unannotated [Lentimonas sp. CC21]CAA7183310.1 Unannotated [Lentimonas sp. CC8]
MHLGSVIDVHSRLLTVQLSFLGLRVAPRAAEQAQKSPVNELSGADLRC